MQNPIEPLKKAMQEDFEFAWAWHCNLAMLAIDAGADRFRANRKAAEFMLSAFDVDVTQSERYKDLLNGLTGIG